MSNEIVYLYDEGCLGVLVARHTYWSVVQYARDGIEYEVQVSNDDYDIRQGDDELDADDTEG